MKHDVKFNHKEDRISLSMGLTLEREEELDEILNKELSIMKDVSRRHLMAETEEESKKIKLEGAVTAGWERFLDKAENTAEFIYLLYMWTNYVAQMERSNPMDALRELLSEGKSGIIIGPQGIVRP
jgi:hypothetical protein